MSNRRMTLVLKGIAMGMAEVVPGVSGGTIAFATGIYDELIQTISRLTKPSFEEGLIGFWRLNNLQFLCLLFFGMALGVLIFSRVVNFFLHYYPSLIWAFFLGIVIATLPRFVRLVPARYLAIFGPLGVIASLSLNYLEPFFLEVNGGLWIFFLGGIIAVCAWLLPAVSGGFFLLTLGLYDQVISALVQWDFHILVTLGSGCVIGALLFARMLTWLMEKFRDLILASLLGLIFGSLPRLWPWQLNGELINPVSYEELAFEPMIAFTFLSFILGVMFLWVLTRYE